MWVDQLNINTEITLPKEQVDNTKLDIDWVKLQIETQTAAKELRDEILNDTDRKLTHAQIVTALKQYENQGWPQVIDKNTAAYVISLQLALKAAGYDPGKIDALYGDATKDAVKAFQKAVWLKEDGSAGPYTIAKLIEKLGGDPKELTPDARPVSTPAEAAPAAPVAPEVVSEKPKDLVEALKKQPLTTFDKKWLKDNLGVEDITKIPVWKEGCNGVAYNILHDAFEMPIEISQYTNGQKEWKWLVMGMFWDRYAWDFKNNMRHWKGAYLDQPYTDLQVYEYVWDWKEDSKDWEWKCYYEDWEIRVWKYKNNKLIAGTEKIVKKADTVKDRLEWKNITFDEIFTKEDLKDPIRVKQIKAFKVYFDTDGIKLDDVELFVQNNKEMIKVDLDNHWLDTNWTQNLTFNYDQFFNKKWHYIWDYTSGFVWVLRKYIINQLFESDKLTDEFTKLKD